MKFREAPEVVSLLTGRLQDQEPREGIHLSDLTGCLGKPYWKRKHPVSLPPHTLLGFALGWGLQWAIFGVDAEQELPEVDGIRCSVDAMITPEDLGEFKSTRKSSKDFHPREQEYWLQRAMGYCKVAGKSSIYVVVFFVCGDYRPPRYELKAWQIEFTEEELADNWQQMVARKRMLERALAGELPVEELVRLRESWECDYCENTMNCLSAGVPIATKDKRR
jgi:hypothetical protein